MARRRRQPRPGGSHPALEPVRRRQLRQQDAVHGAREPGEARTQPFERDQAEGLDWALFAARVEGCKEMKGRKKGGFYLRKKPGGGGAVSQP